MEVLEADKLQDGNLLIEIRTTGVPRPPYPGCRGRVRSKGERPVELVDLPAAGRPVRLLWRKCRWECPDEACGVGSFTEQDPRIAPEQRLLTTRATRWAAKALGRVSRTVDNIVGELGCDRHIINNEVADGPTP